MQKLMTGLLLAGSLTLGACATTGRDAGYDNAGYDEGGYDQTSERTDRTLRNAGTGAVIGGAAGALGGAVIDGVSPIEGAIAGAVVGGVAGALLGDRDGDGYEDSEYYDRDGNGYYDGKYYESGRPMHVKPRASYTRSGERG